MFKTIYVILFVQSAFSVETQVKRPIVRIKQGLLAGVKVYADLGKIVDAYLGIPFAAPPTAQRRFAPPQVHGGWNGTYQASSYGSPCPQLPVKEGDTQNEDCLYLNVWAPEGASEQTPLPVVVFFDGTEFSKSNQLPISGQDLAVEGVIVVNVNYRMNVFGFLCFGTKEARGNMGLLDQYLALIWIKENILHFGGDNRKVTLFGYSAGAASAMFHMISIRTADLFQKAILSSGSVLSPWHSKNNVVKASQTVARLLGCLNGYIKSVLSCLRLKSTTDILKAFQEYSEFSNFTDSFSPVIDDFLPVNDQYLPMKYEDSLKLGLSMQVPLLIGFGKPVFDSSFKEWENIAKQGYSQLQSYIEQRKIPEIMQKYEFNGKNKDLIFDLLKWRYVTSSNGHVKVLQELLKQMYFEARVEIPMFLQLNYLLSSHVPPVYVYQVDDVGLELNYSDYIASSDLVLLFGPILLNQAGRRRFTEREKELSKKVKTLWINFLNYGNPTPNHQLKLWPNYKSNDNYIEYIGYNTVDVLTKEVDRTRSYYFWNHILKNLASQFDLTSDTLPNNFQRNSGSEYKHAMYTLTGLVIALLFLLLVCIVLLKKKSKEAHWQFQTSY